MRLHFFLFFLKKLTSFSLFSTRQATRDPPPPLAAQNRPPPPLAPSLETRDGKFVRGNEPSYVACTYFFSTQQGGFCPLVCFSFFVSTQRGGFGLFVCCSFFCSHFDATRAVAFCPYFFSFIFNVTKGYCPSYYFISTLQQGFCLVVCFSFFSFFSFFHFDATFFFHFVHPSLYF